VVIEIRVNNAGKRKGMEQVNIRRWEKTAYSKIVKRAAQGGNERRVRVLKKGVSSKRACSKKFCRTRQRGFASRRHAFIHVKSRPGWQHRKTQRQLYISEVGPQGNQRGGKGVRKNQLVPNGWVRPSNRRSNKRKSARVK